MKKRILHISNYYSPHIGGIEDICKSIVDNFKDFDFEVLCFSDSNTDRIDYVDGVKVTRAGIWKQIARQSIPYHYGKILKSVLNSFQPDIIHLHLPNPLALLYILFLVPKNIKIIVHWHSDIIVHKHIHTLVSPLEKAILKRASYLIATSPLYLEGSELLKRYRNKCVIIPNIISEKKMNIQPLSGLTINKIHNVYGDNIVLFVGRHVEYKGIEYLIEASKLLQKEEKILIAGQGPLTESLKLKAQGLNNIVFIGRIPDDELNTYMRACKVFAFPSITKNEAFGVVLAEAMYCGAVPVSFTIEGSGVNWVNINGETGLETPNKDYHAFAKAIDELISDNERRLTYSEACKKRVMDNFVIEKITQAIHSVYTS